MRAGATYSLKLEKLSAERQQSVIRMLLAAASSLILFKYYFDQFAPGTEDFPELLLNQTVIVSTVLVVYSIAMWALVKWRSGIIETTMAVGSFVEIVVITYLIWSTAMTSIPFYLWYVFYVVSVATRYGALYSILALSASVVSFTTVVCLAPGGYSANFMTALAFTAFLLVLAFMFGQMSEKQLSYQARLAVVNEFRAELSVLASSKEIIGHLLDRTRDLLHVEEAFFLPAERGADASEAAGLRSAGADPVLLSTFREGGGAWNVEEILRERRPVASNTPATDPSLPGTTAAKLGLRNLAAAPMMVRGVPVGVLYAANRKDRAVSNSDLQLLELVAMQAAPVVENSLLWERLHAAAAAEERLRIARDLHDNFLQTLAAIKLHLERCKIVMQKDAGRAGEGIERIHEIATHGLAEARSYLSELRLMGPEPSRFREAISRCADDAATRGGFEAHLDVKAFEEAMAPNVALAGFQILRELLNNAATHSKAQNVQVRVAAENGKLVLEVEDDGVGFDVAKIRAEKGSQGHLGLLGVEERAQQSDGTLELASKPGKGTRATVSLSL